MSDETAIKFLSIVKPEIKNAYIDDDGIVRSPYEISSFGRQLYIFNPTNTDDVLALAIEWCEKNIEYFCRIEQLALSKKERSKNLDCGIYLCTILQEIDADSGYGDTIVSVFEGDAFVDANSPSQAIMQAVIKAAEAK